MEAKTLGIRGVPSKGSVIFFNNCWISLDCNLPGFHELFMITDNEIQLITIVDHKAETLLETAALRSASALIRSSVAPFPNETGLRVSQFWPLPSVRYCATIAFNLAYRQPLESAQEHLTVGLKPTAQTRIGDSVTKFFKLGC